MASWSRYYKALMRFRLLAGLDTENMNALTKVVLGSQEVNFFGDRHLLNIYKTYYSSPPDRICILLEDAEDDCPFAVLSVNVPNEPLEPDEFVVKNYGDNETLAPQLYDFHRFKHEGKFVELSFGNYCPVLKLKKA